MYSADEHDQLAYTAGSGEEKPNISLNEIK